MNLKTSDILMALGLKKPDGFGAEVIYQGVSTDSRQDCRDKLYVGLSGENFDGNKFLHHAQKAGATGALVEPGTKTGGKSLPVSFQIFYQADTLKGLQKLAGYVRQLNKTCRVVAITGSNGKSTTKEMTAVVLAKKYQTHATKGNLNNHIGVPLTLLGLEPEHQTLVCEIGANHPGEIGSLARLVQPEIALITNIAPAHLEGFGSLEGVLEAKLELFNETVSEAGSVCIYNGDDQLLKDRVGGNFPGAVSFGSSAGCQVRAENIVLDNKARPSFMLNGSRNISLRVSGRHNVLNALAAAAVGQALELTEDMIVAGLQSVETVGMRTELKPAGTVYVLDDSYNANPFSMTEALKTLEAIEHPGAKGVIAGEMLELGNRAAELHRQVAVSIAATKDISLVLMVGRYSQMMRKTCIEAGGDKRKIFAAADSEQAYQVLRKQISGGELLLVKASRGVHLEDLIKKMEVGFV